MAEEIWNSNPDDWEDVDETPDYNDFDIEFIDMNDVEEGDYWIGEYTGSRKIGKAENKSAIFDNKKTEKSYAFTPHASLKRQLADLDSKSKVPNPVEKGEIVAIKYEGTYEVEGRPRPGHDWKLKRPSNNKEE